MRIHDGAALNAANPSRMEGVFTAIASRLFRCNRCFRICTIRHAPRASSTHRRAHRKNGAHLSKPVLRRTANITINSINEWHCLRGEGHERKESHTDL
ncbi:hypothetical protein [Caballeronia sp. CLC5]|uniref:hypothetical protein n=1 Tax=Caballeronia sp. CLC5 TaxID=2906764 RepID=UPI001F1D3182|nr:hypothetical protein [Caballeronia sp. CLC5]MCE4572378.1 hypothetical protein [Caballeronia sp. CLC5]